MIRRPPRSTRTDNTLSLHDALPIYPAGHLVAWHAQLGVHARHDHVETLEHVLVLVERAVLEDVDLDAGEDPERSQLLVQALDLVELLEQPLPVEPVRDGQTRRVVGEHQVLVAQRHRRAGHHPGGPPSVAPPRLALTSAPQHLPHPVPPPYLSP